MREPKRTVPVDHKDEWLTPRYIIEAAQVALGGSIDLDPCAEDGPPFNVSSIVHFTENEDGLKQNWHKYCQSGRDMAAVFVNPPYSRGGRPGDWVDRAVKEWEKGCKIIMLLPAKTETKWIRPLARFPRVFIHGRIKFLTKHQVNYGSGTFPSMIVGLGVVPRDLYQGFKNLGDVYINWR